ncbi:MAG: FHA domain-containing protein [bacterium]|nr:FHA domain-containing protein [bacterium]
MAKCPKCGFESLAGSMFCEKCGHNISGVKVRANPDYQPRHSQEKSFPRNSTTSSSPSFDARPTPAPRPMPAGAAPTPAVRPAPAGPQAPVPAPAVSYSPAAPAASAPVPPAPAPGPAISAEEAALRANAYGALEAKSGQPVFYIARESISIGRSIDNDISLEAVKGGRSVSRQHARLLRQSEGVFVEDLGSSNGTYVNGKKLLPEVQTQLYDNDEIRFGAAQFVFHLRRKG